MSSTTVVRHEVTAGWRRSLGDSGLEVSALGLGAGQIGESSLAESDVDAVVGAALDAGITLFDTARSYGASEERLGRVLGPRRKHVILSTKVGYDIAGTENWTGACVAGGVDAALVRMRTDWIDIVHLHSCPRETLERGDVIAALATAKRAGKLRAVAYSGDNDAADFAVECGAFDCVQTSLSLCDQRALKLARAAAGAGIGVIAKRPVANAPWRFSQRPVGDECELYWDRWQTLAPGVEHVRAGLSWHEIAVRFSVYAPGVSSAIIGTRSPEHLAINVEYAHQGPLPAHIEQVIRDGFQSDWSGKI